MLVKALFLMHIKQYNVAIMMPSGHRQKQPAYEVDYLALKVVIIYVYLGLLYIMVANSSDL